MKDIVIIGAGDFGREVAAVVERINELTPTWNLVGFVDDNPDILGQTIDGYNVVGDSEWLKERDKPIYAVCSLGDSFTRKKVVKNISGAENVIFTTLIDPSAVIMRDVEIGEGSIICAGTVIAVNVKIGMHAILNLNCTVGHDTITGNYFTAHPGSNFSGKVVMGDCNYFGTGSKVIQGLHITEGCIFGAGAVVVKDIGQAGTYIGVPAQKIK